jgi:anti-sigma factor ChrR (cupin superfamily)
VPIEVIERGGTRYAEIIWASESVEQSTFFSPDDSSFQFGILARPTGFIEAAHYHPSDTRTITDLQQMFVVQRGVVAVDFFDKDGRKFHEVVLRVGDAINLVHGSHAIRVLEDMQSVSVKQGPFLGIERDKVEIEIVK